MNKKDKFSNLNRELVKELSFLSSFKSKIILSKGQYMTELKIMSTIETTIQDSLHSLLTSIYTPLNQQLLTKIFNGSNI